MRDLENEQNLSNAADNAEIAGLRRKLNELIYQRGMLIMVVRECLKSPDDARAVARAALDAVTRGYHG
ncbi:MAG: hypothetical protein ABW278_04685 [Steroidobacteraceae bacterium]